MNKIKILPKANFHKLKNDLINFKKLVSNKPFLKRKIKKDFNNNEITLKKNLAFKDKALFLKEDKKIFFKYDNLPSIKTKSRRKINSSQLETKKLWQNKNFQKRKLKIVDAKVFKIDNNYVYAKFANDYGICPLEQVSDFSDLIKDEIKLNKSYKFLLLEKINKEIRITKKIILKQYWLMSYKQIHPFQIYYKRKTIPTASHYSNVLIDLKKELNKSTEPSLDNLILLDFERLFFSLEKKIKNRASKK